MRIKEFQDYLKKEKISYAIFFNFGAKLNSNFFYFSGTDCNGSIVVPASRKPFLLVPRMEAEKARISGNRVVVFERDFFIVLKKELGNSRRIGIDRSKITLASFDVLRKNIKHKTFMDIEKKCSELRSVKTHQEIKIMKKAYGITDNIMKKCLGRFRKFRTESDVVRFLKKEAINQDCEASFEPIVASGKGASQPHYQSKDVRLRKGFCVIDFGVRYRGYCSDMTRTVYLGKPSKKEIMLYELVLETLNKARNSIKEGVNAGDVHKITAELLGSYKKYFLHSAGHGVGIDVHEAPSLSGKSIKPLKKGTIIALEPGIYIGNNMGIRIEDGLLIDKKANIMSKTTKDLLIFD